MTTKLIEKPLGPFWEFMLKIGLLLIPMVVAFNIWVTKHVFKSESFMESGERFTQADARELEKNWDAKWQLIETRMSVQTEILRRIELEMNK